MKQTLFYSVLAIGLLASCSNEDTTLEKLEAKRDSLNTVLSDVSAELNEVSAEIAKMDTTIKKTTVTYQVVEPKLYEHYFEVYGNVEAEQNITIYPEINGELEAIRVKEGDRVKAGQVLMQINADVIRRSISEVEASLDLAKEVYSRQSKLWDQQIGSEIQYLEAKTNVESLETRKATLLAQLDMAVVKAPFEGVVDQIFVKRGQMLNPALPALRIINLDEMYIRADVSERYIDIVKPKTEVKVMFEQLDLELDTTVTLAGSYVNPLNRTFMTRVDIDNLNGRIKPNLLAQMRILDERIDSSLVLPSNLIQQTTTGDSYVYVISGSGELATVHKTAVKLGSSYKGETVVLDGIKPGDRIVNRGARRVQDGQEVMLID